MAVGKPEHNRPAGPRLEPIIQGASPTHAEGSRTLMARSTHGTLCTLALDPAGYPYGSMVAFALDADGSPLFLISDMAEHTANLKRDPRSSILVMEPGADSDRLALGRVTLLGPTERIPEEALDLVRDRYLARHPNAKNYVDFKDFHFYRLQIQAVRYIGGFGRMSWVDPAEYAASSPDMVQAIAPGILQHMNEDHGSAMVRYCQHHAGLSGVSQAVMTEVDRYGFEMTATTPEGRRFVRLGFPQPVATSDDVRKAMIEMLREAGG